MDLVHRLLDRIGQGVADRDRAVRHRLDTLGLVLPDRRARCVPPGVFGRRPAAPRG
ncbi:MAG: hypothetical protein NXH83_04755 [Rhodobacteraceae bacterium]|nr:hypothetical protein [Paracoccaceae bacterium]